MSVDLDDEVACREREVFLEWCSDHPTVDRQWSAFVRQWRDMMRRLFSPRCSRSEPCCALECSNVAEHFARTGEVP